MTTVRHATGITPLPPLASRRPALTPLHPVAVPIHHPDQLAEATIGAKTATTLGATTMRLFHSAGAPSRAGGHPVGWLTLAGFADGMALEAKSPIVKNTCMLAGLYGGYRFGIAAPLIGFGPSVIAISGVTAAALLPQMAAQELTDPLHPAAVVTPNTAESSRAGIVGGITGATVAAVTLCTHPSLLKPSTAIPFVALGAVSGWADGVSAITNQRRKQAITTAVGHVSGFMMAVVPGVPTALTTAMTRVGMTGVALAPFVAASVDNERHTAPSGLGK